VAREVTEADLLEAAIAHQERLRTIHVSSAEKAERERDKAKELKRTAIEAKETCSMQARSRTR
jgi:hypothetical protein